MAPAIDFRLSSLNGGDAAVLAQAAVRYNWLELDGDSMRKAGPAELSPPHGSFIVGYVDGRPVCCGGVKWLDDRIW